MALRTPLTVSPHMYIGDSTGRPLDNGMVYFGLPDQDPEYYPIDIFSDDELTIPVTQPVRTKGGYLNDNTGDMAEIHAEQLIYSVKVLDQYGRKIFYKGRSMRSNWNDDVIIRINEAVEQSQQVATDLANSALSEIRAEAAQQINDAINNTAVESGVLADTFVTATANGAGTTARTQRAKNSDSISVFDFGAISDGTYHPLSEKYATLADAQVQYPHALALTDSIDWCAAQAFLNACHVNQYSQADMTMDAVITRPLTYMTQRLHATQVIGGDVVLRGIKEYPLDFFLVWQGAYTQHTGSITCHGAYAVVGDNYSKVHKNGVLIGSENIANGGAGGALGAKINSVSAFYLSGYAFIMGQSAHFAKVGYVHANKCGSAVKTLEPLLGNDVSSITTFSEATDVGSITDLGAVSRLKVAKLPTAQTALLEQRLTESVQVVVGNDLHSVRAIDRVNGTIDIRPPLTSTESTGSLSYIYGGGVLTIGNDTANTVIERVNAILSGVGVRSFALWGTNITSFTTEFCGAGFVNSARGSISMGSVIQNAYFEANKYDLVELWSQDYSNLVVHNTMGLRAEGIINLYSTLTPTRVRRYSNFMKTRFVINNKAHRPTRDLGLELTDDVNLKVINAANPVVTLTIDENLFGIHGKDSIMYCFYTLGATGVPNTITLKSPSGIYGKTGDTLVIDASEYSRPVLVLAVRAFDGKIDFKVVSSKTPKTSVTIATSGTTAQRPTSPPVGHMYFDTTLGKPVYYKSTGVWVDATGATV